MNEYDDVEIDLKAALTLEQACLLLRGKGLDADGKPKHASLLTTRVWVRQGATVRGQKIKLRAVYFSGAWLTTEAWCQEFEQARLRAGNPVRVPMPRERSERSRQAGHRRAMIRLAKAGMAEMPPDVTQAEIDAQPGPRPKPAPKPKPPGRPRKRPGYRFNQASGQAVVFFPGEKPVYLGKYGSAESREKYDRLIAEWQAKIDAAQTGEG